MKRLDCENQLTALKSLSDIVGIDAELIWDDFLKYDFVTVYENGRFLCDFLDYLYDSFLEYFDILHL